MWNSKLKHIRIKFFKTYNKEKIVKSARGKKRHVIERNKDYIRILLENNANKKEI